MKRQRLILFLSAVVSVALWTYACGDGTTEPPAPDPLQPTAVTVSPATATVVEADTLRLTATATNAYGQVVSGVEFVWASGNTAVAVVDMSGLVTGAGAGEVQVTATAAGVTGRAELTVAAPVPTTVAVTPDTLVLTALGHSTQLTAEVRDQAGRAMDGVPVAWSSADTTVAVVDSSGLVTAVRNGAVTVTATAGEASGGAHVAVRQSAGSVTVSPPMDSIAPGDTVRLVAEAYDENGHLVEGAVFTWSSSDAPVATVDPSGLVRGAGEGTATITATAGDVSGTSEITVVNPDRAALVALYNATDGRNWVDNTNWLTDAPLGEWYGVSTDGAGRVVRIDLAGRWDSEGRAVPQGLRGELPHELTHLTYLVSLRLGINDLSGPIPPELGDLANLEELGLHRNELSGAIPPTLGSLPNLERLWLSWNDLTGSIPPELGNLAELTWLNLSLNYLTGRIPRELGNNANLDRLYIGNNRLTGPIPPELGNLAALAWLDLGVNNLTGPIPQELGNLTELRALELRSNDLTGPIPQSFLQLDQLRSFLVGGQDACVPGVSAFLAWHESIEHRETGAGIYCNATDVAALTSLYDGTGGAGWTESGGWLSDNAVEEWYGVTADSLGHVTELALEGNGLTGRLPATLGDLPRMTVLRISDNALSGRLPWRLTDLQLVEFRYSETELCAPPGATFQDWLNAIALLEGTGVNCEPPSSDRDILEIFYDETGGPDWTHQDNWLTDAPLKEWYGVEVDREGRVSELDIYDNNLTGRIPPELGNLAELVELDLGTYRVLGRAPNKLTGPIPPELGNLAKLRVLTLRNIGVTGPIPPELGNLGSLTTLALSYNDLTGPIPPELGNIPSLVGLDLRVNNFTGPIPPEFGNLLGLSSLTLDDNKLTGRIPPELGNLANLWALSLSSNDLSGSVPPELGALTRLARLKLARNPGLAGALPQSLTGLDQLEELLAGGTELCAPRDAGFQDWLDRVDQRWVALCVEGETATAYLTQAVQSREFPVPLVAGNRALLRVFPTAAQANSEGIPLVRARFYLAGREAHVQDIPGKSDPIPTDVDEGSLSGSANAEIAGSVIQPGLEMVIEVDPDNTLDPELGVAKRIPETGRLAVEVKTMPLFDLTLIPFIWTETHDSSIVDLVGAMAADHEHHELLGHTRTLLPIGALAVTAHEPVLSSSNNAFTLLSQTGAIRVMEAGTGHYMGMMSLPVTAAAGVAHQPGWSSFSLPSPSTIAHELGHNLNLGHAPCGGAGGPPAYPYPDGAIGAWGYDFRDGGRLVRPSTPDVMSYCGPEWISDYYFTSALRYRLVDEGTAPASVSASTRSVLLWGGVGVDSVPYLEPTFVIDAPAALPDSTGDYGITGRTAAGAELFSLSFTMPQTADGDGSSSFAFALPVRAGWEGNLATVTLSGPKGSVTLDGNSDISMAILRDPVTGRVRGFLRDVGDPEEGALARVAGGLDVLFSCGIPGASAWRR